MTSLNIDESQRLRQVIKLKASSIIPAIPYSETSLIAQYSILLILAMIMCLINKVVGLSIKVKVETL